MRDRSTGRLPGSKVKATPNAYTDTLARSRSSGDVNAPSMGSNHAPCHAAVPSASVPAGIYC